MISLIGTSISFPVEFHIYSGVPHSAAPTDFENTKVKSANYFFFLVFRKCESPLNTTCKEMVCRAYVFSYKSPRYTLNMRQRQSFGRIKIIPTHINILKDCGATAFVGELWGASPATSYQYRSIVACSRETSWLLCTPLHLLVL